MFFVQAFFELFETLLSYFSNTLSFVRIGAFAVSPKPERYNIIKVNDYAD